MNPELLSIVRRYRDPKGGALIVLSDRSCRFVPRWSPFLSLNVPRDEAARILRVIRCARLTRERAAA